MVSLLTSLMGDSGALAMGGSWGMLDCEEEAVDMSLKAATGRFPMNSFPASSSETGQLPRGVCRADTDRTKS